MASDEDVEELYAALAEALAAGGPPPFWWEDTFAELQEATGADDEDIWWELNGRARRLLERP